ncbi:MAG: M20/M25/M40 family metallo-hydrolase [Anaerolineales bacterium]|nr:M20/M25/M40 family metallo-hydrolase [Anaerolineales bacterium]
MTDRENNPEHPPIPPAEKLAARAMEFVSFLSETIGGRPPGSLEEQQAQDYIQEQLSSFGLESERNVFSFQHPIFTPWISAAGFLFLLYAVLDRTPLPALLLPLILALAPDLGRWWNRRSGGSTPSSNVYALSGSNNHPVLILCAHVDSGKAAVLDHPLLLKLRGLTMDIAQRAALLLAALGLVKLAGLVLPRPVSAAATVIAVVAGVWLIFSEAVEQLTKGGFHSPGANDNASGVGLVLALAETFASHPSPPFSLAFLFTGAEEAGLHGARAHARSLPPDSQTAVISLDMVGAGDTLRYAGKDGVLFSREADFRLNDLIRQVNPQAQPLWYSLRSGDFAPFLEYDIPATGLQVTGGEESLRYHTAGDTADAVEIRALTQTAQTILDVLALLEAHPELFPLNIR